MGKTTVRSWAVDGAPFMLILAGLWTKLVSASLLLPGEWWAGDQSGPRWIDEFVRAFRALTLNPGLGVMTLALLLAVLNPLALLPRGWRLLALLLVDVGLTAIAITDILHVRFYGDVVSAQAVV